MLLVNLGAFRVVCRGAVTSKQLLITITYSIASILAIAALVAVFLSTTARNRAATEHGKLAKLENYWGYFVTAFLIVLLVLTIIDIPYGKSAPRNAQQVRVIAQQFAWNIQPSTVRAGVPIEFTLSSKDVQHGFGLYEGTKLLFQVQVPASGEKTQKAVLTLSKRGTYTIDCLEFCGYHHHLMVATLRAQ
jgi:cytochrome c oxidase subunit 2